MAMAATCNAFAVNAKPRAKRISQNTTNSTPVMMPSDARTARLSQPCSTEYLRKNTAASTRAMPAIHEKSLMPTRFSQSKVNAGFAGGAGGGGGWGGGMYGGGGVYGGGGPSPWPSPRRGEGITTTSGSGATGSGSGVTPCRRISATILCNAPSWRSEEHTSELQSQSNLV